METNDRRRFNRDGTAKSPVVSLKPNLKRNRKQRQQVGAYRLVPMFDEETRKEWPDSPTWVIEGKLEDHLVVSVPVTTSMAAMQEVQKTLQEQFKRQVLIITHNMEFLLTKRLSPKETADALKRIEDYAEARQETFKRELTAQPDEQGESGDSAREKGLVDE